MGCAGKLDDHGRQDQRARAGDLGVAERQAAGDGDAGVVMPERAEPDLAALQHLLQQVGIAPDQRLQLLPFGEAEIGVGIGLAEGRGRDRDAGEAEIGLRPRDADLACIFRLPEIGPGLGWVRHHLLVVGDADAGVADRHAHAIGVGHEARVDVLGVGDLGDVERLEHTLIDGVDDRGRPHHREVIGRGAARGLDLGDRLGRKAADDAQRDAGMLLGEDLAGALQRIVLGAAIADHDQFAGLGSQDRRRGERDAARCGPEETASRQSRHGGSPGLAASDRCPRERRRRRWCRFQFADKRKQSQA